MDGRIAATKACVIRRIAPDEFAREAELVAVIGERRRQVFDVENGGVPRDLECRIGHGCASRRASLRFTALLAEAMIARTIRGRTARETDIAAVCVHADGG